MSVTAKGVAVRCGLSRETVSLILRGQGHRFRPATCEIVLRAASEMGYRPNSAARAMRSGRFRSIGVIHAMAGQNDTFDSGLFRGISAGARDDLHLTVGQVRQTALELAGGQPRIISEWSCDGLIINRITSFPEETRMLLSRSRIPIIWTNNKFEHNAIFPDDLGSAVAGTQRLIQAGHARIAWVGVEDQSHYSAAERRDGYVQAMRTAGLTPMFCDNLTGDSGPEASRAYARQILTRPDRPTAAVCYSYAQAVLLAFTAASLGLHVPGDLSLVGLGPNHDYSIGLRIALAGPDFYEMGQVAVDMVRQLIAGKATRIDSVRFPWKWTDGETVVPPRS